MTLNWNWLRDAWTWKAPEEPTLEQRIDARVCELLNSTRRHDDSINNNRIEITNVIGWHKTLDARTSKLERRSENIDANYVRVVATAMDEKLDKHQVAIDAWRNEHTHQINLLLRDIEDKALKQINDLTAEVGKLQDDVHNLSDKLASTLARLRAVGEGN